MSHNALCGAVVRQKPPGSNPDLTQWVYDPWQNNYVESGEQVAAYVCQPETPSIVGGMALGAAA